MPQRIRCRFDVFSSEISGLPADTESVKLVVDHQKVSKRYAASDTLPASDGITQLEDPADTRPLMSFICHVYPSKEVNLRLMGSSPRDRPSLLSRGTNWRQLATTTLPLDQLAKQLLLPGVAAGPITPRGSTEFFTRPQITIPETGTAPQTEDMTPTLTASPPSSPFAAASSFSRNTQGQNLLDDDDDVSELFTTDSAAAAVTGRHGQVGSNKKSLGSSKELGSLGDLRDAENDANNDDVRKAAQDAADVPPAAVWGLGSSGGYGGELQSSRFIVNWTSADEGLDVQQQLVVHAHFVQPSRTSLWAQALSSPKKPGSIASSRNSRPISTASGGGFQRRKWADKLYNSLKPDTPAAGGIGATSDVNPGIRDDGSGLPAGGHNSAPAALRNKHLNQAAAAQRVNVHGRLPSFEPWVDSDSTTTCTAAPTPTDTSHLPAGHPLKFFGSGGPSATPHNTPAKPSVLNTIPTAAAAGSTVGTGQQAEQQQGTSAATTDAEDQAAKHEFLQLILATLSSSHSMESDAALPPPSAAQLAAAASLPRAPSVADLEAFAFATGLPIDKVAEAAATKLGTGSNPMSVAASGASSTSSARTSPRSHASLPTDKQRHTSETAAAAATAVAAAAAGASEPRAAASDKMTVGKQGDLPANADVVAPERSCAPVPASKAPVSSAVSAIDAALAETSDVAVPTKINDLAPATAVPAGLDGQAQGALKDTAAMPPAAEESFTAQPEMARAAPLGDTAVAPQNFAAGTSAAAALAAAVSKAIAAAEQGEAVAVVVESVETVAVPSGEQLAVPVVTVAEATLVPSSIDTTAAADSNAGAMGIADVGGAKATAAEPTAVVTATAFAVLDDSRGPSAEQSEAQGWEPQQLAVATTTISATPTDGSTATQQSDTAAKDVVITNTTDVAITSVSDAELADFAAPVAMPGSAAGTAGYEQSLAAEHSVSRGESLGLGAVGEGGAVQLLQPGSRSKSSAVKEANRTAAAAKSAAAAATAWAASHSQPAHTNKFSPAAASESAVRSGFGANGVVGLERYSPAGPAGDVQSGAAAVPAVAVTAQVVQPEAMLSVQQVEEQAAPFASQEALDMYVASSGPATSSSAAAAPSAVTAGVSEILPVEEVVVVLASEAPAAVNGEVEATPEALPAVQESSSLKSSSLSIGNATARSAQPGQQQSVFIGQPALLKLQQSGSGLQSTPSGTSRLAEVLERISSQPLASAESVGVAPSGTWRTSVSNGEAGTTQDTGNSSLIALASMLAAAGSIALAIPAFLFSTLMAALSLAGNTAVRRARARRSSSGGAVSAAQSDVLTSAANAAYYQGKRAVTTAWEVALYVPYRMALALFNLWLLIVTALVVRPGLAMLDHMRSDRQAPPTRNVRQMSAVTTDDSQAEAPAATPVATTAAGTESETSPDESSSSGGTTEDLQANAAAVELLSGASVTPPGGWLLRMRQSLSRSPSVVSSIVPPTPAPSLETGQVYSGLMERSWSSMLSLITPLALSRSPSVSSVAATPPSTPLVTSSDASFTSSTGMPQLDLSPATSATSVTAVVAGPTLGSSSRPLTRRSRLGQSTGPGLATIASVTDLAAAAAAAEPAGESDEAEAAEDTGPVNGTTTLTEVAAPDVFGYAAPWVVSSWLWSAVTSTAGPAVTATYNSNSNSWWPAWMSSSAQSGYTSAVTDGQDVVPPTPTPSVASGWLPGWMQYSRSSSLRSSVGSAGSQVSSAAADAAVAAAPGAPADDRTPGGTSLDSAVDIAPRSWLGFLTYQSAQWCHVMMQLLNLMFTPVAWYVDAVTSVLRSGVHTTTWLVELAVWWALLPGRLAWWSVTLPWKATHAVLSFVLASDRQGSSRQHVVDPVTHED